MGLMVSPHEGSMMPSLSDKSSSGLLGRCIFGRASCVVAHEHFLHFLYRLLYLASVNEDAIAVAAVIFCCCCGCCCRRYRCCRC